MRRHIDKFAFIGVIDAKTKQFLFHRFNDIDVNWSDANELYCKAQKLSAVIRFLVKLQKPSLGVRHIENDVASLHVPMAQYIARILQGIQNNLPSCFY